MAEANKRPLFSIIIAVLNGVETLSRALDSVAGQTWAERELIVIDGGSTDGTRELLEERAGELAYWESAPDRGLAHAWNKALERARGEWLYFLGADDYLWDEQVLERLAAACRAAGAERLIYGRVQIFSAEGTLLYERGGPWVEAKKALRRGLMGVPHQGAIHHRSLFAAAGPFDESFRIAADYEFYLRILAREQALFQPGLVVAGMRYGGLATKRQQTLRRLREGARARQKNGYRPYPLPVLKAYSFVYLRLLLVRLLGERRVQSLVDRRRRRLSQKG